MRRDFPGSDYVLPSIGDAGWISDQRTEIPNALRHSQKKKSILNPEEEKSYLIVEFQYLRRKNMLSQSTWVVLSCHSDVDRFPIIILEMNYCLNLTLLQFVPWQSKMFYCAKEWEKKKKKVLYSTALSKSNLILKYKKIPFLFKTATTLSFVFK